MAGEVQNFVSAPPVPRPTVEQLSEGSPDPNAIRRAGRRAANGKAASRLAPSEDERLKSNRRSRSGSSLLLEG